VKETARQKAPIICKNLNST